MLMLPRTDLTLFATRCVHGSHRRAAYDSCTFPRPSRPVLSDSVHGGELQPSCNPIGVTHCLGGRSPAPGELVRPSSDAVWASPEVTGEFPWFTARSGTQRARAYVGEHLIRRSRQVVQGRPSPVVGWADIPELSTCVGCCAAMAEAMNRGAPISPSTGMRRAPGRTGTSSSPAAGR